MEMIDYFVSGMQKILAAKQGDETPFVITDATEPRVVSSLKKEGLPTVHLTADEQRATSLGEVVWAKSHQYSTGIIQTFPFDYHAHTRPMQFGSDWPGVFIRGDDAKGFLQAIKHVRKQIGDDGQTSVWAGMEKLFASCLINRD